MSGVITGVGIAELPTHQVALGIRRQRHPGNGSPSDTLDRSDEWVEVVTIGKNEYVLRGPDVFAVRRGLTHDSSIVIKHDEDVTFLTDVAYNAHTIRILAS